MRTPLTYPFDRQTEGERGAGGVKIIIKLERALVRSDHRVEWVGRTPNRLRGTSSTCCRKKSITGIGRWWPGNPFLARAIVIKIIITIDTRYPEDIRLSTFTLYFTTTIITPAKTIKTTLKIKTTTITRIKDAKTTIIRAPIPRATITRQSLGKRETITTSEKWSRLEKITPRPRWLHHLSIIEGLIQTTQLGMTIAAIAELRRESGEYCCMSFSLSEGYIV